MQNLGRNNIEVSLAKPLSDKRKQAQVKREQRKTTDVPFNSNDTPSSQSAGFNGFNSAHREGGRSDGSFSS